MDSKSPEGAHTNWLLENLRQLRDENKYCDITIRVQKETFNCHKVVLSAASRYFDAMFCSGMSESNADVISLSELRSDIFSDVLSYIYGGKNVITSENVELLLHVACRLQIERLINECEDYLTDVLSVDNCVGFWMTASNLHCKHLRDASFRYILLNFDDVWTREEFLKLDKADLLKIIKDDDLQTTSEELVCNSVIRWMMADHRRRDTIAELIPELRLCQVDIEYILENLFKIPEIHKDENAVQYLQEILRYHCLPEARHQSKQVDIGLRNAWNKLSLFVIFGKRLSDDGSDVTELIGYSQKGNKWYTLCSIPRDFGDEFAMCPYVNDVWVSGGTKNPTHLARFSAKECKWVDKPKMESGRYRHCMVAMRDVLYCMGGYNDGVLGSVEEFDMSSQTWRTVGELHFHVAAASAAALNKQIFIFGGSRGLFNDITAIQCYDIETNVCSVVDNFPTLQKMTRAITYNKAIYTVCSDGTVYQFGSDMSLRKVDNLRSFQKTNFGVYKTDESMYIIGGIDMNKEAVLKFDCLSDAVVKIGNESASSPIPEVLPIPFEVFGCYSGVFQPKYPLPDLHDTLAFGSYI